MKYARWFVLFMLGTNVGIAMFQFYTYIFFDITYDNDKIFLNIGVGAAWILTYLMILEMEE